MKNCVVVLFFFLLYAAGYQYEKPWATCEHFPNEFLCHDWCVRLNRYSEAYLKHKKFTDDKMTSATNLLIKVIFLAMSVYTLIWTFGEPMQGRRKRMKRKRHEMKLKYLRTNRINETMFDAQLKEEIIPDPTQSRPIRDGVIYKMRRRKELMEKYIQFRRNRMREELRDCVFGEYKTYDILRLPEKCGSYEFMSDGESHFPDFPLLKNDPEFVVGEIALLYQMSTPINKKTEERQTEPSVSESEGTSRAM